MIKTILWLRVPLDYRPTLNLPLARFPSMGVVAPEGQGMPVACHLEFHSDTRSRLQIHLAAMTSFTLGLLALLCLICHHFLRKPENP